MMFTISLVDGSKNIFSAAVVNIKSDMLVPDGMLPPAANVFRIKIKKAAVSTVNLHHMKELRDGLFKLQTGSSQCKC